MSKRVAIILNSPYLGGAERSIIYQTSFLEEGIEKEYFIPIINSDQKALQLIEEFINKNSSGNIAQFYFPMSIYQVSRSGRLKSILLLLFGLFNLFKQFRRFKLHSYDIIWANGNKVAFTSFAYLLLSRYRGRFFWHFRDYPSLSSYFKFIWNVLIIPRKFKLTLIGNSFSVSRRLEQLPYVNAVVKTIYNPIGLKLEDSPREIQTNKKITIGVVSMLAPWKGIHQIPIWASLFEKELIEFGVETITIYGGAIYKTAGEHEKYQQQIKMLNKKFQNSLIRFYGSEKPEQIFSDIDLIIHTSIDPEPFGRVIVEAFGANVPVISTSLGGAGELVKNGSNGLSFVPFDYYGLFQCVQRVLTDENYKLKLVKKAAQDLREIEQKVQREIAELIRDN